jgi:nucleoside-diphosphate-sugar epimerase
VRDAAALERAARGCDVVFHLAARASVVAAQEDPALAHAVNATGTLHALLAAREARVRRVVFASTCALFGDSEAEVQGEGAAPRPASLYAIHKLCGELYCREFVRHFGVACAVLGLFNVYGPRQDPNGAYAAVVPRFLAAAVRGERLSIFGDGEQSRDFVYVGDVVRALLAAADVPGAGRRRRSTSGPDVRCGSASSARRSRRSWGGSSSACTVRSVRATCPTAARASRARGARLATAGGLAEGLKLTASGWCARSFARCLPKPVRSSPCATPCS